MYAPCSSAHEGTVRGETMVIIVLSSPSPGADFGQAFLVHRSAIVWDSLSISSRLALTRSFIMVTTRS